MAWTRTIDAAMGGTGLANAGVRVEQNCLLLEAGGKRALFDNGLGRKSYMGRTAASCWLLCSRPASTRLDRSDGAYSCALRSLLGHDG